MRRSHASPSRLAAGLVLGLWAGGCAHDSGKESNDSARKAAAVTVPWTVRVGARGGFTGGGSGELVHSDGTVQSWSQVVPAESVSIQVVGKADPKRLHALEQALADPKLLALQQQEEGNMTGFLEWSQAADFRRWSWVERAGDSKLPAPLEHAYRAALDAVASAQHK